MKAALHILLCSITLFHLACGEEPAKPPPTIETEDDRLHYALGLAIGQNMGAYAGNLTEDQVAEAVVGLSDIAMKRPHRLKMEEFGDRLNAMGQQYQQAATDSTVVPEQKTPAPLSEDEKNLYYAFGLALGRSMGSFVGNLTERQVDLLNLGFADVAMKRPHQVDMNEYGPKLNALDDQHKSAVIDVEKKRGAAYLAEAAAEEGAITTETGLVYKELVAGTGPPVQSSDVVVVHYTGTLVDGTQFDSSRDRNQPAEFPLGRVIKGWQEGLPMMKVGGRATLVVPSDLGYGDNGWGANIPPGATLVFDIEVLEIK